MKLSCYWSIEEDHNKEKNTSLIGRIVYKSSSLETNPGYILTTTHLIGWDVSKSKKDEDYYKFISLADGMTVSYTLEQLIDCLNSGEYIPINQTALKKAIEQKVPFV